MVPIAMPWSYNIFWIIIYVLINKIENTQTLISDSNEFFEFIICTINKRPIIIEIKVKISRKVLIGSIATNDDNIVIIKKIYNKLFSLVISRGIGLLPDNTSIVNLKKQIANIASPIERWSINPAGILKDSYGMAKMVNKRNVFVENNLFFNLFHLQVVTGDLKLYHFWHFENVGSIRISQRFFWGRGEDFAL